MCGIVGYLELKDNVVHPKVLKSAVSKMTSRGPNSSGTFVYGNCGLGHTRLSIIDLSQEGNQPMLDHTGRYVIAYNGEVYNYKEIKKKLEGKGVVFASATDTEVVLNAYIQFGESCLNDLNGFFAFAIYDKHSGDVFLARDKSGIKPLYWYQDEEKIIFASEIKAIVEFGIDKAIDEISLYEYLQRNYITAPNSIFEKIKKISPGYYMKICKEGIATNAFYEHKTSSRNNILNDYDSAKKQLRELLKVSVSDRLMSDVPLGAFLSGGVDSSIISGLAVQEKTDLQTFSIGYADESFFDETEYANLMAKRLKTDHTVFNLSTSDLEEHINDFLDYHDEPFADSSALPTYILSKKTKAYVSVALSGDGADELFGGYNKYYAVQKAQENYFVSQLLKGALPILEVLPKSRNGKLQNKIRQLHRFASFLNLSEKERYWFLSTVTDESKALAYLKAKVDLGKYEERRKCLTKDISEGALNEYFLSDLKTVLPGDMLYKVDKMSMANSLEVRVPFLDHRIMNLALSIPTEFKMDGKMRKKILKEAFKDILPLEILQRSKKGFEVPLLKLLKGTLKGKIDDYILNRDFIETQGLFNYSNLEILSKKLTSSNPEDSQIKIWNLMLFQHWWKKYMDI